MLGAPLSDLLYLSSKVNSAAADPDGAPADEGGLDAGRQPRRSGRWKWPQPPPRKIPANPAVAVHRLLTEEPAAVQEFVRDKFQSSNRLDQTLYRQARAAIVAAFASDASLNASLAEFRHLRAAAVVACGNATHQQCYWQDNGCGFACLDRVASRARRR